MDEPEEFEVRRLVNYLEYRDCEILTTFPCVVVLVRNRRTHISTTVPAEKSMIRRELIYWICLKLGVNMPDEFQQYQRAWDDMRPDGFDPATRLL